MKQTLPRLTKIFSGTGGKTFFRFRDFFKDKKNEVNQENFNELQSGRQADLIKEKSNTIWLEQPHIHGIFDNDPQKFYEYCYKQAVTNKEVLATLLLEKSSTRQGIQEKSQVLYITNCLERDKILDTKYKNPSVKCIEKPINLYLVEGKETVARTKPGKSKSIDLIVRYCFRDKVLKGLCTLKYTTSTGGSQNNQETDVINSNKEFIKIADRNTCTFSIIDGDYYTEKIRKPLILGYANTRNKIVTSDTFPIQLINSIVNWLKENFLADDEVKEEIARLLLIQKSIKTRLSK